MGISLMSSCSVCPSKSATPMPAPNPARFEVKAAFQIGTALMVRVHYLDCTNYEGVKVLVYKNTAYEEFRGRETLDPHFAETGQGPFARFEPTGEGWEMAVDVAEALGHR